MPSYCLVDNISFENTRFDVIMNINIYDILPDIIGISCFIKYQGEVGLT